MNILLWVSITIAIVAVVTLSMNWSPYQEARPFKVLWPWLIVAVFALSAAAFSADAFISVTLIGGSTALLLCLFNPEQASILLEKYIFLITAILGLGIAVVIWPLDKKGGDDGLLIVLVPSGSALMTYSLWAFIKRTKVEPGSIGDII